MECFLAVTRLSPNEWIGGWQKLQLFVQTCCAPNGLPASHVGIYFKNVPPDLVLRQNAHALASARGASNAIFETTHSYTAFATWSGSGSWHASFNQPEVELYHIFNVDPYELHASCIRYASNPRAYGDGFKYQSTLCKCCPFLLCSRETSNCVGTVLYVVADSVEKGAASSRQLTLETLGLRGPFPESYTPSVLLFALQSKGWVAGEARELFVIQKTSDSISVPLLAMTF